SFPIAFDRAEISGTEVKVEVPRWRDISASLGYTYMVGVGWLPNTGGLFLGEEAASALASTERFPISQDQRHTLRGPVSYQISSKVWVASAVSYGSGLPVEFDGNRSDAIEQFGQRIVDRVDFESGRVRSSFTLDASSSFMLFDRGKQRIRVQADVL